MKLLTLFAATAAAGALIGAPASAQPSEQDKTYLVAAHQANLAEIAAGQLAQQKGTAPVVKELGARFATDHARLDDALRPVAQQLGVALPTEPNEEQKAIAAQLQAAAAGSEFDRLWISAQLAAHEKSMAAGEAQIAGGSDAAAKKVAGDAAPVVAMHHEALMMASQQMGVPSRIDAGSGGNAANAARGVSLPAVWTGVAGLLIAAGLLLRRRKPADAP